MNEATSERRPPSSAEPGARLNLRAAAGDITIRGLLETLWRGWWLLLLAVGLAVLLTGVVLKLRSPLYTASMVVAPAPTDLSAASQLAAELEQFAGLAALAQSPVKLEWVSDLDRYVQLLGSTTLAARLQAEHGLLQQAFADEWNAETESWRRPTGVVATIQQAVLDFFGFPPWTEPDVRSLAEWLTSRVNVSRMAGGAMLRLRMEHKEPEFAAAVVAMVHATTDRLLREEALARTEDRIELAERELAAATSPTRRRALEDLLSAQYQAQALLQADQPYAAQVMVPVSASPRPTSPNPLLVLMLAAVVGAIVGVFLVFIREALRSAFS